MDNSNYSDESSAQSQRHTNKEFEGEVDVKSRLLNDRNEACSDFLDLVDAVFLICPPHPRACDHNDDNWQDINIRGGTSIVLVQTSLMCRFRPELEVSLSSKHKKMETLRSRWF